MSTDQDQRDGNDGDDWDDFATTEDSPAEPTEDDWDEEAPAVQTVTDESGEPPLEIDPEDPVHFPDQFYEVREGYEHEGSTIMPGSSVQIKCGNCAVWETPLKARGGKPLCQPGLKFLLPAAEGEEPQSWRMQEDRYSCQTHFVPKDMEDVLQFITDDLDQVRMLLWSFPVLTRLVKLQQRIVKHHEKNGGDPEKSINAVVDFMLLFSSEQQMKLVKPFIKQITEGLAKTQRKQKRKSARQAFHAGDTVTWEIQPGKEIQGFIRTIGGPKKRVTIIVAAPYVELLKPGTTRPIQWQRSVAEWKKMNPKVVDSAPLMTE